MMEVFIKVVAVVLLIAMCTLIVTGAVAAVYALALWMI